MTPQRSFISRLAVRGMVGFFRFYQLVLSPMLGHSCRFQPTCSAYAIEALKRHGPVKGLGLTIWRVARCNPFGGSGYDPVPPLTDTPAPEAADDAPLRDDKKRKTSHDQHHTA